MNQNKVIISFNNFSSSVLIATRLKKNFRPHLLCFCVVKTTDWCVHKAVGSNFGRRGEIYKHRYTGLGSMSCEIKSNKHETENVLAACARFEFNETHLLESICVN